MFCSAHKHPGMVNVKGKKCQFDGCKKTPTFNMEGETAGMFCVEHKQPGMVDVKHKMCQSVGCKKRTWFGIPGSQPSHCADHKQEGMVSPSTMNDSIVLGNVVDSNEPNNPEKDFISGTPNHSNNETIQPPSSVTTCFATDN